MGLFWSTDSKPEPAEAKPAKPDWKATETHPLHPEILKRVRLSGRRAKLCEADSKSSTTATKGNYSPESRAAGRTTVGCKTAS